jgi:uncharacterized protein involved in exopolysaccharide biosynthesis
VPSSAAKTRPEFSAEHAYREVEAQDIETQDAETHDLETRALETSHALDASSARMLGHLRLFWEERRMVGRWTMAGLALGTVLAFVIPAKYQSTAQLMPPDTHASTPGMLAALTGAKAGMGLGAIAGDLLGNNSTGALFVGILRSRTVEDRLVERFNLQKVYREKYEEDARIQLAKNTDVSEDRKSGIVSISLLDHDPARAAAMAQAYVEELDRLVRELSTSSAHRERVFLEERLKVVKKELDEASQQFSRFASQNTAIDIPEQGKAMVMAAATLQGQLIAAESELRGLSEIYTEGNARVRTVQARVLELRRQLEKLAGDNATGKPGGVGTKDRLSAEASDYPSIRQLPLLGVTYSDLLLRTKIQEAVYETLTQEYELAKVQEAKETPSVKVLDTASIPERRYSPHRLVLMISFSATGLVAGLAWVVFEAGWNQTAAGDPRKMLAQEVLDAVGQSCRRGLQAIRWRVS